MGRLFSHVLVLLVVASLLGACRATVRVQGGEGDGLAAIPSVLGPEDIIEIQVYLEETLSGVYPLDLDGNLSYPLVGTLPLAGLTAPEAAQKLRDALADGYLRNPQVSVIVQEFNSRKISVLGQIRKPGRYDFHDGMTLVEAIAVAGGTTDSAVLRLIQVTRKVPDPQKFDVPFKDITLGRSPDFALLPGDIILVEESAVK